MAYLKRINGRDYLENADGVLIDVTNAPPEQVASLRKAMADGQSKVTTEDLKPQIITKQKRSFLR
ncbi:hypothetical protein KFV08_01215 [Macrococcoides canis]|uniref:Uncharacterized protein n=1 Tax=Macrococcoides canis TaxID=1855823 RepID=A0AAE6X1S0_9STAP|nr:hypothetical protein [Macrococcus canis]MCO4095938.1 hypothetical protein [Macrococcus canis]QIH78137.1 hypothetical protein GTN30_05590 [Macrococcus canis]UTH09433.1 hypothetical protein KFV08_01215 [Macrococcus canis]